MSDIAPDICIIFLIVKLPAQLPRSTPALGRRTPSVFVAISDVRRCHGPGPGVVAGSRTMHISNITNAISKFLHFTHVWILRN